MSSVRIDHNPDLKRLWDAGYDLEVTPEGYLLVKNVPYVNEQKAVKKNGVLVTLLSLNVDSTIKPETHEAFFIGEKPCYSNGTPIKVVVGAGRQLTAALSVDHHLSAKDDYPDYYEKVTRYVSIISNQAKAIDDTVTAQIFLFVEQDPEVPSVFNYIDTNSTRAEISPISEKLAGQKIGIIGLGGTGSYILDFVAKTPVAEIHLFDSDNFLQHNAFRAPGAIGKERFQEHLKKVAYFAEIYSGMHRHIIPHPYNVTTDNIKELEIFTFIFLSMDSGPQKKAIIQFLEERAIPYIDCGLGMENIDNSLKSQIRVTSSSTLKNDHVKKYVSFEEPGEDIYDKNIQVADLNCLNAVMAVIRWKKLYGFYHDLDKEHHCTYVSYTNEFTNSEFPN